LHIIGAIASNEQSRSIHQAKQAIAQIDQITRRNAALAGRATLTAQSLEVHASKLNDAVSAFRLTKANTAGPEAGQAMPARWRA